MTQDVFCHTAHEQPLQAAADGIKEEPRLHRVEADKAVLPFQ